MESIAVAIPVPLRRAAVAAAAAALAEAKLEAEAADRRSSSAGKAWRSAKARVAAGVQAASAVQSATHSSAQKRRNGMTHRLRAPRALLISSSLPPAAPHAMWTA